MMNLADQILDHLRNGPATCFAIGQALGIRAPTVSTYINKLVVQGHVWRVGETKNSQGNVAYIFAVKEHRTVLLDDYWPMPVKLPSGETSVTHREGM